MANLSNFENWQENGAKTATERATAIWQQTLRNFEVPATGGEQITERLQPYIERKIQRGGAAPVD